MRWWGKLLVVAALPMALGSCLWGPGKFAASLAVNRAGTFVLDYRGEIMLQVPDGMEPASPWAESMARCYGDGDAELADSPVVAVPDGEGEQGVREARPCSAAEIARLKAQYERQLAEQAERKKAENEQVARLMGLPGLDDESNRRFAESLMKQKGWKSVRYKGRGLFEVDYHIEGQLGQDFVFPVMPDSDLLIPFVSIRPRADGSVKISAPALVGGAGTFAARAKALGLPDKGDGPPSRAEGRFTVSTDGEILTNNSEDGPVKVEGRRQLHWDVGPSSQKVPELMIRLVGAP